MVQCGVGVGGGAMARALMVSVVTCECLLDGGLCAGASVWAIGWGDGVKLDAVAGREAKNLADTGACMKFMQQRTKLVLRDGELFSHADGSGFMRGADEQNHRVSPIAIVWCLVAIRIDLSLFLYRGATFSMYDR